MNTIDQLRKAVESIGGKLDPGDDFTLTFDAPAGYVWDANGEPSLAIHYATSRESWLTQAVKEEAPRLLMGLSLVIDPDEVASIEYGRDESWKAPEGSPAHLDFPKNWKTL